jgi:hypothetical protein
LQTAAIAVRGVEVAVFCRRLMMSPSVGQLTALAVSVRGGDYVGSI